MHKYPRSFLTFHAIGGFPFCSIYPPEPQALSLPRSFHFLSRRFLEEGERPASCMKHPAYRADIIPDPKLVSTHGPEGSLQTRDRVRLTSVIHMAPSNRPRAMSPSRLHMGSCRAESDLLTLVYLTAQLLTLVCLTTCLCCLHLHHVYIVSILS